MSSVSKGQHAVKPRGAGADAFSALVIQVLTLASALQGAGDELSGLAGQSSARWQVLAAVEHEPATVAAVARVLRLARQSVQRLADLLVRDGLAVYQENPAHARAKLLLLTPAGRHSLLTIQAAQVDWAERVAADLDPARLLVARDVLAAVQDRLDRTEPHVDRR